MMLRGSLDFVGPTKLGLVFPLFQDKGVAEGPYLILPCKINHTRLYLQSRLFLFVFMHATGRRGQIFALACMHAIAKCYH